MNHEEYYNKLRLRIRIDLNDRNAIKNTFESNSGIMSAVDPFIKHLDTMIWHNIVTLNKLVVSHPECCLEKDQLYLEEAMMDREDALQNILVNPMDYKHLSLRTDEIKMIAKDIMEKVSNKLIEIE